jgi:hypothetical protein
MSSDPTASAMGDCGWLWSLLVTVALGRASPAEAQDPRRSPQPGIVVSELTLNGVAAPSSVTVSSDQAGWTAGGKCPFTLGYHLKNAGAASTRVNADAFATEVSIAGLAHDCDVLPDG